MKLNTISLVKCKAFSSKTIILPTDMKDGLVIRALNRESICSPLASAQWHLQRLSCLLLTISVLCMTINRVLKNEYILQNNNFLYLLFFLLFLTEKYFCLS